MNNKGQVAIWVILSLVLVGAILIFFIFEGIGDFGVGEEFGIEQYMHKCVRQAVDEALFIMLPQGGFLEPRNYKMYNDTKVEYLCESKGYYVPCMNKHPMLMNEMIDELRNYSEPRVMKCFENLEDEAGRRGIDLEMGDDTNITISLVPRRVMVDMQREITVRERESEVVIDSIRTEVLSPIYDLAGVAVNIANHEAKYCYFEYVGYMMLDKSVFITKFMMSDSTSIYTIRDKQSGEKMSIAIKGCAIPPGGL